MKTARERLAFRIAEKIQEEYSPDNFFTGCSLTPEEIMPTILALLPQSYDMSENENDQTIAAPRSSDCSTDRIEGSEQSQKGMWQEALIDVSACLTVEALVRAGVKPKTIYAMRNALESPRPSL